MRLLFLSALAAGFLAVLPRPQAADVLEQVFSGAASWHGEDYARARDALLTREPGELSALLARKLRSANLRERLLAGFLKLRLEQPARVAAWREAVLSTWSREAENAARRYLHDEATGRSRISPDWSRLPQQAAGAPAAVLADLLFGEKGAEAAMLQFALEPSPELAAPMLELASEHHRSALPLVEAGLAKLGPAVQPLLRRVLAEAVPPPPPKNPHSPSDEEREIRDGFFEAMVRAQSAARVLARLGDAQAGQRIAALLERGDGGWSCGCTGAYLMDLAEALADLGHADGLDALLNQLLRAAATRSKRSSSSDRPSYAFLRRQVIRFGTRALPAIERRLASPPASEVGPIVLAHLVAELSGEKGKKLEAAALRETLCFEPTAEGYLALHRLTGEDVLARLQDLARSRREAVLALGELKDARAVPFLAGLIDQQHEQLERELGKRKTAEGARAFDPRTAREAGEAYRFGPDLAAILSRGDAALLALRRIGGKAARAALGAAAGYPEYRARAAISRLLLDGRIEAIAARLASRDHALREEAALALLEREDARATAELLRAAARRHGPAHETWKARARASRDDLRPPLRKLVLSRDVRERVLAESMLQELRDPEGAARVRTALQGAARRVGQMHVWRIEMLQASGQALAKGPEAARLGERSAPLLEAACLFGQGILFRGIAAFALAELKKPRSMPALAASFDMGSLDGSNPAALALAAFGPQGAELAAKVPPPRPGEHDTGLRMTRHRGGVRVLAEKRDVRGVDGILAGLGALAKDRALDAWGHRAGIYLSAAERFHDERLVEPLLRILGTAERPERDQHHRAIELLSAYDDPRLPGLFLQRLATLDLERSRDKYGLHTVAARALTRRLGARTPDYLLEALGRSRELRLRAGILLALGELSHPRSPPFPGRASWWAERPEDAQAREAAARRTRARAFPALVRALEDRSEPVSRSAAVGLLILAQGNRNTGVEPDPRAAAPLVAWCRRHETCPHPLPAYLADHGGPEAGRVLLAILKAQPADSGDGHIVEALRKLKPEGAVPVLVRNVRARFARYEDRYGSPDELDALADFGPQGAQEILKLFQTLNSPRIELAAARLLADLGHEPAREPIEKLLRSVIRAGPQGLRLAGHRGTRAQAYAYACRILLGALRDLDAGRARRVAEEILREGPEALRPAALEVWAGEKAPAHRQ
ncbi:MAG: hypothetical protein JXR96_01025 [Deltaproteobacteria bacterium]|nr:hypothetical protein [Deltaproteobacteria bacterium]